MSRASIAIVGAAETTKLGKVPELSQTGLHADADNLTGAVRIYRRVGMEIVHVHDNWEKEIRAGEDLRVTGS